MPLPRHVRLLLLALGPVVAHAQQAPIAEETASPRIFSLTRNVNAGVTFSSLHDSQTGWATLIQPAAGYSFNDVFSLDVTVPIYTYRLVGTKVENPPPNALLVPRRGEFGDVLFGLHAQFIPYGYLYQATVSATAPTGDPSYGLSTGHATYDFSNRIEHPYKFATPGVELGIGNSSSLANPLVQRDYTSLGSLAHFQAGVSFALPREVSFETNAYEQLPLGDQKMYQTFLRRGRPTVTLITGRNVAEDNGFTNSIDLPVNGRATLSAYYSRSLRLHDDVVAFGITYVLRSARAHNKDSPADEQLLRSIQQQLQPPQ